MTGGDVLHVERVLRDAGLPATPIVPLGAGLDHSAFLAGGELVVRFFLSGDGLDVEAETRLLRTLAPLLPVAVPDPVLVLPDERCMAYPLLPGVPLLDVPDLPPGAAVEVGRQLGEVLRAVATGPADLAPPFDLPPAAWLSEAAELLPDVAPALSPEQRSAVETFLATPPPDFRHAPVLCHNDLGIEHVLVDPATFAVTGVIDWSDAAVTDPAYDHGLLLRDLGPEALAASEMAPELHEAAEFYARCALLEDLAHGLGDGPAIYAEKSLAGLTRLF